MSRTVQASPARPWLSYQWSQTPTAVSQAGLNDSSDTRVCHQSARVFQIGCRSHCRRIRRSAYFLLISANFRFKKGHAQCSRSSTTAISRGWPRIIALPIQNRSSGKSIPFHSRPRFQFLVTSLGPSRHCPQRTRCPWLVVTTSQAVSC